MPRIENAKGLTLTNIVEQLDLQNQDSNRKLLSSGNDLYVKGGTEAPPSREARERQRKFAIDLVCDSLVAEFGVTLNQAQRILTNVLGQEMLSQITVSDVLKIKDIGGYARRVAESHNRDLSRAFELALGVKEFPHENSFDWADRVTKSYRNEQVDSERRKYESKISALPMYEENLNEAEKESWLGYSLNLTGIRVHHLWRLPPEQKLSMLLALVDHKNRLPLSEESLGELKSITEKMNKLNDGFHLLDLTSVKEMRAQSAFFQAVSGNEIVRTGSLPVGKDEQR